jgi:DNA-binding response OmpR family regulator
MENTMLRWRLRSPHRCYLDHIPLSHMAAQKKKCLLIIEDSTELNRVLCLRFKRAGFDVMACSDGRKALDCLRKQRFDGVILDLVMPIMDGFHVLEKQMATLYAETPFFILTALPLDEKVMRTKTLGARRVISKLEYRLQEFIKMVRDELGCKGGNDGRS